MKIAFLGDSITEGVGASKYENCYVATVGKILNAECLNYGVSGTRIARQTTITSDIPSNYDFNLRVNIIPDDVDKVVCFGGSNDFGHGCAPLGDENDESVFTFYGATKALFKTLLDRFGKEKVLIILPLPRYNDLSYVGDGENRKLGVRALLKDYSKIEREIATKLGLKVVDYSEQLPVGREPVMSEFYADGLHPNDNGHKQLGELIVKDLK